MAIPKQVNRAYIRRRVGQELFLNDRPLDLRTLIESIEEDFQVRISVEESEQLFAKHIGGTPSINIAECWQSAKVGHFRTEHFGLFRRGREAL